MLADARAVDALVDDFTSQWLNLRRVDEVIIDPERYPDFDDNLLEVAQPMRVVQTLDVGRSPEGLKWSPDGRFLAVGCQNGTTKPPADALFQPAGRLLMLSLNGGRLHQVTEAPIGQWTQGIAFSRDGGTMLVQDMVGKRLQVFGWDGTALTPKADVALGAGAAAIGTAWR